MRAFRSLSPWIVSALLLAACGGGDPDVPGSGSPSGAPTTKGAFTAVVSFGDSLSDVGTYMPVTSLARRTASRRSSAASSRPTRPSATGLPGANALGKIWVENVASSLGVTVTAAEVGFNGQSVKCPAAAVPALATTCTAYGQGGSRVTDPTGIGHNADGSGALTVPVVTQIANHLAASELQVRAISSSSMPAAMTSSRSSASSAPPRHRSRPTPRPERSPPTRPTSSSSRHRRRPCRA